MITIEKLPLSEKAREALEEIRQRLKRDCGVEEIILCGFDPKAEGIPDPDLDLVVLTGLPISSTEKQAINDLATEINLKYSTAISTLVLDKETWEVWSNQDLYQKISKNGIWL